MQMTAFDVIFFGVLGALVAEGRKVWQRWNDLDEAEFRAYFSSLKFISLVEFLAVCGAIASAMLYDQAEGHLHWEACLAAGGGAQAILRNLFASAASGNVSETRRLASNALGVGVPSKVRWIDILR